jgi:hypothetical protein
MIISASLIINYTHTALILFTFNLFFPIKKIYIALSDLIMLMNSWQNPVPEIIQRFESNPII